MTAPEFYKPSLKGVSQETINELRPLFDSIDKDHNGHLNKKEIKRFFRKAKLDEFLAPIAFEICDTDKSGTITFNEFIPFFKLLLEMQKDPVILYKNLFNKFDGDHNGSLDYEEAANFVRYFVPPDKYSDDVFMNIFKELDENNDGVLTFDEIISLLNK